VASILICCTPAHGHVIPALAAARHLHTQGHAVRFLTSTRYAERVQAAGLEFLALPAEADVNLDEPNETFPERANLRGPAEIRFSLTNLFVRPGTAQLRAIDEAIAAMPVDVVFADPLFMGSVLLHARPRRSRPAVVALGIVPLAADDPDVAPYGLGLAPLPGPLGRIRNSVLRLAAGRMFAPVQAAAIDAFRAAGLQAPPHFSLFNLPANVDQVVQFTVPGFEYPRSTLPRTVRFAGPLSSPSAGDLAVPPWWGDLDSGVPVVHVTQGTIANRDLDSLVRPTLEALAHQDVLVVVSTGGGPLDALPSPLPANARAATYLPYDRLFPKLSVFVSNGGYGGLHYALKHAVPIVATGTTEDKIETTARVAWSGAGINLRTDRPSPAKIGDAVRRVLRDDRYRRAAGRLSAQIAAAPGLTALDQVVEELTALPRVA
jgi:MGT family glycosyltransferase